MTCKHERWFSSIWHEGEWQTILSHDSRCSQAHARICATCGAWLPLGASQDAGEHAASVAIEQRAAELALNLPGVYNGQLHIKACADCELCGIGAHAGLEGHWEPRNARDPWHAGYLARCIATHQDPK